MNPILSLFRRAAERRGYRDLLQLDDYLLRDIGLTRTEARKMAVTGGKSRGTRFDT